MYDTNGTRSVCRLAPTDYDIAARTNWLRAEIARKEQTRLFARREREEQQAMRLLDPVPAREAFAWFGLSLGLLPPAAIFCQLLWFARSEQSFALLVALAAAMTAVCCLVGRAMARSLARAAEQTERRAWWQMLILPALLGSVWGLVTGSSGGLLFFGIGAFFGAACAVPVGALAFSVFMLLHRLLARGGMIEERQLWPLAFGIPSVIAAAILGMQ
jgi:hypothetical protein